MANIFSIPLITVTNLESRSEHADRTREQQTDTCAAEIHSSYFVKDSIPFVGDQENWILEQAINSLTHHETNFQDQNDQLIVFHGSPGTGKTALAYTLIERIKRARNWNDTETICLPAIDWSRQLAQAFETNSINSFRKRYRSIKGLVLDNAHELIGKPKAQEELQRLADSFQSNQQVLVLTLPSLPNQIDGFSISLSSRLMGGYCLPTKPPGKDARRTLLSLLLTERKIPCHDDALDYLTDHLDGTFPQLKSAINRLCVGQIERNSDKTELSLATKSLQSDRTYQLDRATVQRLLNGKVEHSHLTIKKIAQRVAIRNRLRLRDLQSQSRKRAIVQARGIAMYLCRRLTDESLDKIGDFFGGRDHTTVLHAYKKIASNLKTDPFTQIEIRSFFNEMQLPIESIDADS